MPTYDAVGRITRTDTLSGSTAGTLALRTETTYLGDGKPAQVKYSEGATPTLKDTLDFAYDASGRQTKVLRGTTVLSEQAYNDDGTLAWRKDGDANAIGQSSFTCDWPDRLTSVDLPTDVQSRRASDPSTPTHGAEAVSDFQTWDGRRNRGCPSWAHSPYIGLEDL